MVYNSLQVLYWKDLFHVTISNVIQIVVNRLSRVTRVFYQPLHKMSTIEMKLVTYQPHIWGKMKTLLNSRYAQGN